MHSGPESLGAPPSFTARRPNASNLPNFELPPPPLSHLQKFQPYSSNVTGTQASAASGVPASVGNLLTPPSTMSSEGISPISTNVSSSNPAQSVPSYPAGYTWSPPNQGTAQFGFPPAANPQSYGSGRGLLSPPSRPFSQGSNSPTPAEALSQSYDSNIPPYATSGSMSAPPVPSMQTQQLSSMLGSHSTLSTPTTQPSPVSAHDQFARPSPTPTYYSSQQTTPQTSNFSYSSGPSPVQQSPLSAGGSITRLSPTNGLPPTLQSSAPSPHHYQRPFGAYPLPGPVLSNINNPGGSLHLMGGMPHGMIHGFNSGHAASFPHMYGAHHPPQQQPTTDRPFKCDQCPQSFNRNHDLKRHKRIHLAVKPFPCGHCDKSFSRKDALKRHILVKGCGKAEDTSDGAKADDSSPVDKHAPDMKSH